MKLGIKRVISICRTIFFRQKKSKVVGTVGYTCTQQRRTRMGSESRCIGRKVDFVNKGQINNFHTDRQESMLKRKITKTDWNWKQNTGCIAQGGAREGFRQKGKQLLILLVCSKRNILPNRLQDLDNTFSPFSIFKSLLQ